MTSKIAILLTLYAYHQSAYATLVERDWQTAGDALITYDTNTGLEWLDIPATSDMSYNEVAAAISNDVNYLNFSFASKQQVNRFFTSAGLQEDFNSTEAPEEILKIQYMLDYWGVCWFIGTGERTEFITSETSTLSPGNHWSGRLVWFPPGTAAYTAQGGSGVDDDNSGFTIGSALVRNAVPVTVDGDLNEDGLSNAGDLKIMIDILLNNPVGSNIEPGHGDYYPAGNPDGIINTPDFILMLKNIL